VLVSLHEAKVSSVVDVACVAPMADVSNGHVSYRSTVARYPKGNASRESKCF
jgi:hypothetical protein